MKRAVVEVVLVLTLTAAAGGCQAQPESASAAGKALSGVWYYQNRQFNPTSADTFSWGRSPIVVNNTLVIDAVGRPPMELVLPAIGGPFPITTIETVADNLYRMRFIRKGRDYTEEAEWLVHHDPQADTIWFSDLKFYEPETDKVLGATGQLIPEGPERGYKRVGGPPR